MLVVVVVVVVVVAVAVVVEVVIFEIDVVVIDNVVVRVTVLFTGMSVTKNIEACIEPGGDQNRTATW